MSAEAWDDVKTFTLQIIEEVIKFQGQTTWPTKHDNGDILNLASTASSKIAT